MWNEELKTRRTRADNDKKCTLSQHLSLTIAFFVGKASVMFLKDRLRRLLLPCALRRCGVASPMRIVVNDPILLPE